MANAPKCKFCGGKHWLREPHVYAEHPGRTPGRVATKPALKRPVESQRGPEKVLTPSQGTKYKKGQAVYKYRDPDKRRAYMKEYMRRVRRGKG